MIWRGDAGRERCVRLPPASAAAVIFVEASRYVLRNIRARLRAEVFKAYGYRRAVVDDVVRDYLKCGDLREGFTRVRCPDCRHEYLLTFSCKGRWFCPSCHAKKAIQFGELLRSNILSPVPHRQYVFTLPKILRIYFRYNRKLLSKLCHCANRSLVIEPGANASRKPGKLIPSNARTAAA